MLLLHAPMYTGIATSIPSIPVYTKYELAVDLKRNGKNKLVLTISGKDTHILVIK